MAFGGIFNPNYNLLPQQPGQVPQLPPSSAPLTQQGYGNSDPMALYSLYGLLGTGNQKGSNVSAPPTVPQVPTVPTVPNPNTPPPTDGPSMGSRPVGAPSMGSRPAAPNPNFQGTPYVPNPNARPVPKPGQNGTTPNTPPPFVPNGGYGQPGQYAAPNPGNDPRFSLPTSPPPTSEQGAYDRALADYNSPEYAAYYNSLAPSTRAFMHAPGNAATGQYLADGARSNYQAFGNNVPWVPNR
jgi:hypothetical protein